MSLRVEALFRYPVKGFSPEPRPRLELAAGGYVPGDRVFAIENGPSGFDPASPVHLPKIRFLMLMKNAALARLVSRYDDASGVLTLSEGGAERVRGDLATQAGRRAITEFLEGWLPKQELRGPLGLLTAPEGYRFTDSSRGFVSILNTATLAELETRFGVPVAAERFRANVVVSGLPAWAEADLVGRTLAARSGLVLKLTKRIDRCAATAVDPATGLRDLAVVEGLMRGYGHVDCGVYAEIVAGGTLAQGERLSLGEAKPAEQGGFPAA